jgi:hypothetical protein
MIIETRIPTYAFATLDEDTEADLQEVCKRFAREMTFNIEYEYYSIYWHEYNWTLANIAMPDINRILTRMP